MRSSLTKFPNGIDDRICFSDCDLEKQEILIQHNQLVSNRKYTDAKNLLMNNDIDYFGAWLINLLENRVSAIGKYLLEQEKPNLLVLSNDEPDVDSVNFSWIGDN